MCTCRCRYGIEMQIGNGAGDRGHRADVRIIHCRKDKIYIKRILIETSKFMHQIPNISSHKIP